MKINKITLAGVIDFVLVAMLMAILYSYIDRNYIDVYSTEKPKVAIVIDDFGNNSKGTDKMLELPFKFTGAVMPSMEYTATDTQKLREKGKEVILHQPMEAHTGKISWLGNTPILGHMSIDEVKKVFKGNIESIGEVSGFNNHMGSLITEDSNKMRAIMEIAKENNMFYLDSVTTAKSVAFEMAKEIGVPAVKRDVFLDSTQSKAKIKENVNKTIDIALEKGKAVAIGHVGAEGGDVTADALREVYEERGNEVDFVGLGELAE